jgi:hypothetical protein
MPSPNAWVFPPAALCSQWIKKTVMIMIPKICWKVLLGAGLLVMAQSTAFGIEATAGKAKPMKPSYKIVDIKGSGLGNIREKDPRILAIRAFSIYKGGAVDEGLKREVISLTYSDSRNQANVISATYGVASDSLSSIRYVAILVRDGELWRLKQARKQWICQQGRGHQEWSALRCE